MATNDGHVPLHGSERTPMAGAQLIGPSDPEQNMSVTLYLRRSSGQDLQPLVGQLGSQLPADRKYLSREELETQHGASPADMDAVEQFAHDFGLNVVEKNAARRSVLLSGTVDAFCNAFRVKLMDYRYPGGVYRGRQGPLHIPAALQSIVTGVFGLDDRPQARPHFQLRHLASANGHATGGAVSYLPPQIGAMYQFPTNLNGKGQCIGILEFGGGYSSADLKAYFKQLGLSEPHISSVSVDGVKNHPSRGPNSPDAEVMLDIECSGAIASGASIVVYFAPFTEQGWVDAVTTAVHDNVNKPSVLSISWGYTEGALIWTQQAIDHVNQAFEEAAALGVTVCCAAGDDGSNDQANDGHAHVDFPASSPYVLACGGTSLRGHGGAIDSEVVWNDGPGSAGGGGISDMNALPSWQQGIVPMSVNPDHHVGRGVPDVAGDGDPATGYVIRVHGADTVIGGTSAVAPLWAGLIACINEGLSQPLGYFDPLLYSTLSKEGVCRDITQGSNDDTGYIGGYSAGPGWDACTGWGSPNGAKLLMALGGATGQASVPVTQTVSVQQR